MITLYSIRPKGFNIGNDAIFMGLKYFIYKTFGEQVNILSLAATSRYESQAKGGLNSRTIHEINQYADGVIIGGGNLYENGELDVNLDALKALDIPLMVFSVSRGRIYNRKGQLVDRSDVMPDRIIKALDEKAFISLGRDQATYQHMQKIGCEHAVLGGCPTVYLDRMLDRLPAASLELEDTVLISIRSPQLMNIPIPRQANVRNDLLALIDLLNEHGYKKLKFLCHDHRDIEFASSFAEIEYIYTEDIYTYLNLLRSCQLNVSYRLHSALPCLSFGRPSIKISYDERASSLLNTLGFGEWNINMMESQDLMADVADRLKRLDSLPELLKQARPLWDQYYQTMTQAFEQLAAKIH